MNRPRLTKQYANQMLTHDIFGICPLDVVHLLDNHDGSYTIVFHPDWWGTYDRCPACETQGNVIGKSVDEIDIIPLYETLGELVD